MIVELIMLASLSNLLTFTSTRLSVILIYNFSQIVERIWRKKLYNCVSISGHANVPKGQTAVFGFISVDEIIIVNLFVFVMSLSSGLGQVKREDGVATKVCCTEPATARSVLVWNWFSAHGEKKDFGSEKTVRRLFVQVELIQRRVWKELLGRQLPTRQVAGKKNCSCGMRFLESATRGLVR